jgi:hypothetical protein
MFVWMAKFGAAYGVRTGIHVGVDVLINRMNRRWRNKFVVFGLLAGAAVHRHHRHPGRQLRAPHGAAPTRPRPTWKCRCGSSTWRCRSVPT